MNDPFFFESITDVLERESIVDELCDIIDSAYDSNDDRWIDLVKKFRYGVIEEAKQLERENAEVMDLEATRADNRRKDELEGVA